MGRTIEIGVDGKERMEGWEELEKDMLGTHLAAQWEGGCEVKKKWQGQDPTWLN